MTIPSKQLKSDAVVVAVSSSPFSILQTHKILNLDTSAPRTLNLLAPNLAWQGNVTDATGQSGTNGITLARGGGFKINGVAADLVLKSPGATWWIYSDTTDYWVVGPV